MARSENREIVFFPAPRRPPTVSRRLPKNSPPMVSASASPLLEADPALLPPASSPNVAPHEELAARPPGVFVGQNRALAMLVAGEPLTNVFTALVQSVEVYLADEGIAAILLLDPDGKRLRHGAAPSLPDSYNCAIDGIAIGPDIGTCCAAAARNEVVITEDIANDPNWTALKDLPLGLGLRAAWSMPIRSSGGTVLGTFGTYFRSCRPPTALEREIVGVMAKTAAVAIEQRATVAALLESESFLQGIIGASADCIKVLDLEGRLKWMSENGLCLMEVDDIALIRGADWVSFWPDEASRDQARQALQAARLGGMGRFRGFGPTLKGTPKWWDVLVTAIYDADGAPRALLSVSRETTDRKRAEDALAASEEGYRALALELEARVACRTAELAATNTQLRTEIAERTAGEHARQELRRKLVTVEEDERRRISRELHDHVGQNLTALLIGLQTLRDGRLGGEADLALRRLEGIAEKVGKEIHDLALELRPTALDDLGLARALSQYVSQWSAQARVPVEWHQAPSGAFRLPARVETTIYRIVQETLTNVLKHAQARRVSVILELRPDHALAIVEDDGAGFDVERQPAGEMLTRLGLLGMRERASLVQGSVNIESRPGKGTTVFVRIPLPAAASTATP